MEVPATRPEVTTTGIYGEELAHVRQRLTRSELAWCGDLTARTQVLVVGRITPIGSRKLMVARGRQLPCVSPAWVTRGDCAIDHTAAFDVCHELAGREVCTTSLSHTERSRVQAVCAARSATYNPLLTRQCGLLVAPAGALAFTSPAVSSPATANDKLRFARRHGLCTMTLEEFLLRYGADSLPSTSAAASSTTARLTSSTAALAGSSSRHRDREEAPNERDARQPGVARASSYKNDGPRSSSDNGNQHYGHSTRHRVDVSTGGRESAPGRERGDSEVYRVVEGREVLVPGSVRCTALSTRSATTTPRPSAATSHELNPYKSAVTDVADSWRNSAVQPTLPSQLTAVGPTGASLTRSQSLRLLGDEFSDVVAYCSPPALLTTAQHDLLTGMGVSVAASLTPYTTHVLVLRDTVEECLYPRPGLQIVSWQWVAQSQAEQRRLSCAGFRVPFTFCPVITFTGLLAGDRQELVAALHRSGLACEVQEALVLGGAGLGGGEPVTSHADTSARVCLPRSTTHLISLRRHLLTSQKVAVLAQHRYRRRPSTTAISPATPSPCQLIGVDWIYRSIQHGQWLDPEIFTLSLPHPEAFTLAAVSERKSCLARAGARGAPASSGGDPPSPFPVHSQPFVSPHAVAEVGGPAPTLSGDRLAQQSSAPHQALPPASALSSSSPSERSTPHAPQVGDGGGQVKREDEVIVVVRLAADGKSAVVAEADGDGELEEGAALSQRRPAPLLSQGEATPCHSPPGPLSHSTPTGQPLCSHDRADYQEEEDEAAGGVSPSATAELRTALQALHTSQPHHTPRPSQAEKHNTPTPSSAPSSHHQLLHHPSGDEPRSHPSSTGGSGADDASPEKSHDALAPHSSAHQVAANTHTFLATQYSPGLENLLGELEAYPTEVLGGGLPFAALSAPAPQQLTSTSSMMATTTTTTSISLARQISEAAPLVHDSESMLGTPPSFSSEPGQAPPQRVLQRASLRRQRFVQRQHQQQQQSQEQQQEQQRPPQSVLAGRSLSDESQVVFYQMEMAERGVEVDKALPGEALRGAPPSEVEESHGSGIAPSRSTTDSALITTHTTATASAASFVKNGAATTSSAGLPVAVPPSATATTAAATTATATPANRVAWAGQGLAYAPSTVAHPMIYIARDVWRHAEFDRERLKTRFPQLRVTKDAETCTHYIAFEPTKSEPFLCCVAAGRWVLTPAYLTACMAAGYFVREDAFEWTVETAATLGCRASAVPLVACCAVQRQAAERPFARWQVRVCCTSDARTKSFMHVLRSGGCTSMMAATADDVLAAAAAGELKLHVGPGGSRRQIVLADCGVFTEEQLAALAQCAAAREVCPALEINFIVQHMCTPDAPTINYDLLQSGRLHKRLHTEVTTVDDD